MLVLTLPDEKATLRLGAKLADLCPARMVIFFNGELGAGKTTLIRGFIQNMGYSGVVKSPTYTLVEPYLIKEQKIYHFDLYRLHDPEELELIGIRDYFVEPAICLVEWPERAIKQLPSADVTCYIQPCADGRSIQLKAESDSGQVLLDKLANQYRDADQKI